MIWEQRRGVEVSGGKGRKAKGGDREWEGEEDRGGSRRERKWRRAGWKRRTPGVGALGTEGRGEGWRGEHRSGRKVRSSRGAQQVV